MPAQKKPKLFAIPIDWQFPEKLETKFANHLLVQFDQNEFYISFFEMIPPLLLGTDEEQKKILGSLKSIPAKCVSRIVVSKERMPSFIKALQTHAEKHIGKLIASDVDGGSKS
jgi:hypothetical protein